MQKTERKMRSEVIIIRCQARIEDGEGVSVPPDAGNFYTLYTKKAACMRISYWTLVWRERFPEQRVVNPDPVKHHD